MGRWKTSMISANLFELVALLAGPWFAIPGFFFCRDIANGTLRPALLGRLRVGGPVLAASAIFWPDAALTIAIGYAMIAAIHFIAGLELQPMWFRSIVWATLAAIFVLLPLDGLAFFPVGALIADLCMNRRPSSYLAPHHASAHV
jgi:hypothetical protein